MKVIHLVLGMASASDHLLRINPTDGHLSFDFSSPAWTSKGIEYPGEQGSDFLSKEVADSVPIEYLRLQSQNTRTGQTSVKLYRLKDEFRGQTFHAIMSTAYRASITEEPYDKLVAETGFDWDPIMKLGGGLRANMACLASGIRLSSNSQHLFDDDSSYCQYHYFGLGVDWMLSKNNSKFVERTEFSAEELNQLVSSGGQGADASSVEASNSYMGSDKGPDTDRMQQEEMAESYIYDIFVSADEFQISDLDRAATCGHDISCLSKHLQSIKSQTQPARTSLTEKVEALEAENAILKAKVDAEEAEEAHLKEEMNDLHEEATAYHRDCLHARAVMQERNKDLTRQWCEEHKIAKLKDMQVAASQKGVSLGEMAACQFWAQGISLLNPITLLF